MKISELVDQLQQVLEREGDIEVTCTSSMNNGDDRAYKCEDAFETTVENLIVTHRGRFVGMHGEDFGGTRVRLWL